MFIFSFADVSNHAANPFALQYSSICAGSVTKPSFFWSHYKERNSQWGCAYFLVSKITLYNWTLLQDIFKYKIVMSNELIPHTPKQRVGTQTYAWRHKVWFKGGNVCGAMLRATIATFVSTIDFCCVRILYVILGGPNGKPKWLIDTAYQHKKYAMRDVLKLQNMQN